MRIEAFIKMRTMNFMKIHCVVVASL